MVFPETARMIDDEIEKAGEVRKAPEAWHDYKLIEWFVLMVVPGTYQQADNVVSVSLEE